MPQSTNVTAEQMRNIPEQAAESAATSHNKTPHLSAHEETVLAEDRARNTEHASKLHHGKAAALEAEKSR
jgi:hypothetical protein